MATRREPKSAATSAAAQKSSAPKTTRPPASERRPKQTGTAEKALKRRLDAMPDRIDIRDWTYQPTLAVLPRQIMNIDGVPKILDQGQEGACTGYGLATVINFHLAAQGIDRQVSPRMLYEMARKYDEWPGADYEGSSARGAMIGWVRHGVASEKGWPSDLLGAGHLDDSRAKEARNTPGGAYYRVMHSQVRDVHAAIAETGAVYMTIMVHSGWDEPGPEVAKIKHVIGGKVKTISLPIIARRGRADDGHAVAIVGYTSAGFIIQNSWGPTWGYRGFALLPYEDFMIHVTDVWAAQLGVPVDVDVWSEPGSAETSAGLQRAAEAIPLTEVRPFIVDCGNNGRLSDNGNYWTTEQDIERLFEVSIPEAAAKWSKKRVMVYLHGGLNSEDAVARRVVAFRDVLLENEIYPLHIMWESGAAEIIRDLIENVITRPDERAGGVADWMHKLRDRLLEAKDRTFEITTARLGTAMWSEMKRNAALSSDATDSKGAMQIIPEKLLQILETVPETRRKEWEFHVVAHSAGSIYFGYALPHFLAMTKRGVTFSSVQFMAPAITTALFKDIVMPHVTTNDCPTPTLYVLSDVGERDDTVGPYGKSLLYLVSNAFEGQREVPLLGMKKFIDADHSLKQLFSTSQAAGYPSMVIAGAASSTGPIDPFTVSRSDSHGGFDNDPDTLNSVVRRILGRERLKRAFTERDLQY
jgi:hypothetical protein